MCPRVNVTPDELVANVPLVISWPAAVSLLLPSPLLTCTVTVKRVHGGISQPAPRVRNREICRCIQKLDRRAVSLAGHNPLSERLTVNSSLSSLYVSYVVASLELANF